MGRTYGGKGFTSEHEHPRRGISVSWWERDGRLSSISKLMKETTRLSVCSSSA